MIYYWGKVLLLKGLKGYSEESMPLLQFDEKKWISKFKFSMCTWFRKHDISRACFFCTNTMAMSSYIFKDKAKHNDNVLIFKQVWLFLFVMQADCCCDQSLVLGTRPTLTIPPTTYFTLYYSPPLSASIQQPSHCKYPNRIN